MTEEIVSTIGNIIENTLDSNYKKTQSKTVEERYEGLHEGFEKIVEYASQFKEEITEYMEKRTKQNEILKEIQSATLNEISKCIDTKRNKKFSYELIPASSFTAKTNLIGESDLDILLLVENIDITMAVSMANSLGKCEYVLSDIRNEGTENIHWVFNKYISHGDLKVEIEVKVRDKSAFTEFMKMHDYLDNHASNEVKQIVTYIKYILKNHKEIYNNFKIVYYGDAGYHGKSKKLLFKLIE